MAWQRTDSASITLAGLRVILHTRKLPDGYGGQHNALFANVIVDEFNSYDLLLENVGSFVADVTLDAATITSMQNAAATGNFVSVLKAILIPVALGALPKLGYTQV